MARERCSERASPSPVANPSSQSGIGVFAGKNEANRNSERSNSLSRHCQRFCNDTTVRSFLGDLPHTFCSLEAREAHSQASIRSSNVDCTILFFLILFKEYSIVFLVTQQARYNAADLFSSM